MVKMVFILFVYASTFFISTIGIWLYSPNMEITSSLDIFQVALAPILAGLVVYRRVNILNYDPSFRNGSMFALTAFLMMFLLQLIPPFTIASTNFTSFLMHGTIVGVVYILTAFFVVPLCGATGLFLKYLTIR